MFSFDAKPGGLNVDPDSWSLGASFDTALGIGADSSYTTPRTGSTVPTNAIDSMQPVSTGDSGEWGGFFRDLTRGLVGYAVQRDAVRNGVTPSSSSSSAPATGGSAAQAASRSNLVPLVIVGVVAVVGAVVLLKN
jgi:hypothetical protein